MLGERKLSRSTVLNNICINPCIYPLMYTALFVVFAHRMQLNYYKANYTKWSTINNKKIKENLKWSYCVNRLLKNRNSCFGN